MCDLPVPAGTAIGVERAFLSLCSGRASLSVRLLSPDRHHLLFRCAQPLRVLHFPFQDCHTPFRWVGRRAHPRFYTISSLSFSCIHPTCSCALLLGPLRSSFPRKWRPTSRHQMFLPVPSLTPPSVPPPLLCHSTLHPRLRITGTMVHRMPALSSIGHEPRRYDLQSSPPCPTPLLLVLPWLWNKC